MYKILIADDEPLVQIGIKSMITSCQDNNADIIGIAANGKAALEMIQENRPDIVITDIKMPILSGLELVAECRKLYNDELPVFIILTSFEEFSFVQEAIRQNVADYIVKLELTPAILKQSLEKAMKKVDSLRPKSTPEEADLYDRSSFLTDQFFIRLLHGMYRSQEEIDLQCHYLGLSIQTAYFTCLYVEFQSPNAESLSKDRNLYLYHSSVDMFRELLSKYLHAEVITLDTRHCAVIVYSDKADTDFLYSVIQKLNDNLNNYYRVSLKCAIGNTCQAMSDISLSFQYARQAFSYLSENQICISADCLNEIGSRHRSFNLSLFRDSLITAFDEYDSDTLTQILSQLSSLFSEHPDRVFQALDASCNILHLAIASLPDGEAVLEELFHDYPDSYRNIYQLKTTEQIVKWLQVFGERLSEYFKSQKSTAKNHTVTAAKRYICDHISEKLSLNEVAETLGISPNYLSQLFKKYNDCGFTDYVSIQKIEKAKKLMQNGNVKIYEISDMLGFDDAFYFSRVFKKYEGLSPKDYLNTL